MKKTAKKPAQNTERKKRKTSPAVVHKRMMISLLVGIVILLILILVNVPRQQALAQEEPASETAEYETRDRTFAFLGPTPQPSRDIPSSSAARDNHPSAAVQNRQPSAVTDTHDRTVSTAAVIPIKKTGRIAVVIDDAGNDAVSVLPFLKFKGNITIAVLPLLPNSKANAEAAHRAGKEVILHLPMEPVNEARTGPGVILVEFDKAKIIETMKADFATVPYASGINNHMGSLATADDMVMDTVFEYLKQENMFFLDSRTTAETLGTVYAEKYSLPFAERKIFLDSVPGRNNIIESLKKGIEHAQQNGSVVVIGHVQNPDVIAVLNEQYDELVSMGIEFVTVRELIDYNRSRIQ